jgi:hypothetical protein
MPRSRRSPIEQLRTAIDCLPVQTRAAMLEGVRGNDIIVGAYADRRGGVCPMLAAHRCGGRTDFISFARAWDRFAGAARTRRATEREVRVLTAHLEASLLAEDGPPTTTFGAAIAEHTSLTERRRARRGPRVRPGDPDRSRELQGRAGRHWLRPFRRYDEYKAALARVEAELEAASAEGDAARELELV